MRSHAVQIFIMSELSEADGCWVSAVEALVNHNVTSNVTSQMAKACETGKPAKKINL